MLDKYLVLRQHSKAAPVFTLGIANNYPPPSHIIIENLTVRDTEMGLRAAFSYPQLDQLYLTFPGSTFFEHVLKQYLLLCCFLCRIGYCFASFWRTGIVWIKETGQKEPHTFWCIQNPGQSTATNCLSIQRRETRGFVPAVMIGWGTGLRIWRGELFFIKSLPLPTKSNRVL